MSIKGTVCKSLFRQPADSSTSIGPQTMNLHYASAGHLNGRRCTISHARAAHDPKSSSATASSGARAQRSRLRRPHQTLPRKPKANVHSKGLACATLCKLAGLACSPVRQYSIFSKDTPGEEAKPSQLCGIRVILWSRLSQRVLYVPM